MSTTIDKKYQKSTTLNGIELGRNPESVDCNWESTGLKTRETGTTDSLSTILNHLSGSVLNIITVSQSVSAQLCVSYLYIPEKQNKNSF